MCVVRDDLAFSTFLEPNFPSFSVEVDEVKNFGKLIHYLIEFYT